MGKHLVESRRPTPIEIQLAEKKDGASTAPTRLQLMRAGKFRDFFGDFDITKEMFANMKKNFDENVRRIDLAVDYSHENYGKAAGWIRQVELEDDGLYIDVEWTPEGARAVSEKEFRYLSAEFDLDYQDNEKIGKYGVTLLGAGLTNRPFIKEMAPATLSEMEHTKMNELEKKLADVTVERDGLGKQFAELKESTAVEIKSLKEQILALEGEKIKSEKIKKFEELMRTGKAVEAQRDAYLSGDVEKFSELANEVNLTPAGSNKTPVEEGSKDAGDEVLELAEKLAAEKKLKLSDAISAILRDNRELAKRYHEGV